MTAVVVVPTDCHHCRKSMEVECEHSSGFGYTYAIDCPYCDKRTHHQLPGRVLNVFKSGDSN
jgi:hypothetical protein